MQNINDSNKNYKVTISEPTTELDKYIGMSYITS